MNFRIPDYSLLRCIGRGSSGKVWLARNNRTGLYHAVKVIFRDNFAHETPYLRELRGIRKFEPVSRSHPGFVNIFRVDEEEGRGYFYYVMELADSVAGEMDFDAERYQPKTVETQVREGCRFAVDQVLELGLRLSDALHFLHETGLVHRDIKPSNLLFVSGRPKLADIGLVTDAEDASSLVGTPGYIPPEGAGSRQADVFALGKVLYECLTGLDRTQFPALPSFLDGHPDHEKFLELNDIVLKACHQDPRLRYGTARQLHADLTAVENGESVVRLRQLEFRLARFKRMARLAAIALLSVGVAGWFVQREFRTRDQDRQRTIGALVRDTGRSVEVGDYAKALRDTAAVLKLSSSDRMNRMNRFRYGTVLDQLPKLTLLQGLDSSVNWCEFAANDAILVVGLGDGRCQVRDAATGAVRRELTGHTNRIHAAIVSPDGTTFLTAGEDGSARLWNSSTSRQILRLEHPQAVMTAAFSPDGSQLVTGCTDGILRLWDRVSGALVREFVAHSKPVTAVRFNHSGTLFASSGRDGSARLWKSDAATAVGESFKHSSWVVDVGFSPDDQRLVTSCSDHSAYVWSVDSGSMVLPPLRHERGVRFAEFSPDGSTIVTAGWDDLVCLWDSVTGGLQLPTLGHSSPLICAKFSASGHQVVSGCTDGTLRVWNLAGRKSPVRLDAHSINEEGNLFVRLHGNQVEVFAVSDPGRPRARIQAGDPITRAFLNHDGSLLATIGDNSGTHLRIWNVAKAKPYSAAIVLTNSSPRIFFDRGGLRIAVIENNSLTLYAISTGQPVSAPVVKNERIESIGFSSNGDKFALASSQQVEVRDATTGRMLVPPLIHQKKVKAVVFSPNSKQVVTCTSDSSVGASCYSQVWDVETGLPVGPQLWHRDGVLGAVWGRQLITYSEDGVGRSWSIPSGLAIGSDMFHRDQVAHVSVRSESELVITGSQDRSARLWDAVSGDPVSPYYRFPGSVRRTWLSPDSTRFLVQESSGALWVQSIQSGKEDPAMLQTLANVLAGRSTLRGHTDELVSARELTSQWEELRAKRPEQFSVSTDDHLAWLRFQIERFQRAKQSRFELFCINEVLRLLPSDATARQRKMDLERARFEETKTAP